MANVNAAWIFIGNGNFHGEPVGDYESPLAGFNPVAQPTYKKIFESGRMMEIFNLNKVHQQDCYVLFMSSVYGSEESIMRDARDKTLPVNVRKAALEIIVAARKNGTASGPGALVVKKAVQTSSIRA